MVRLAHQGTTHDGLQQCSGAGCARIGPLAVPLSDADAAVLPVDTLSVQNYKFRAVGRDDDMATTGMAATKHSLNPDSAGLELKEMASCQN